MEQNIVHYTGQNGEYLKMKCCTFFGHRDTPKETEPIDKISHLDLNEVTLI